MSLIPQSQVVASVPTLGGFTNASQINHIFDKVGQPDQFFNEDGFEYLIWNEIDECSYGILEAILTDGWRLVA